MTTGTEERFSKLHRIQIDMPEPGNARLRRDDRDYKVYRRPSNLVRYTVAGPTGRVVACTYTLWGAKRAIGRDRTKTYWWEQPEVYSEKAI